MIQTYVQRLRVLSLNSSNFSASNYGNYPIFRHFLYCVLWSNFTILIQILRFISSNIHIDMLLVTAWLGHVVDRCGWQESRCYGANCSGLSQYCRGKVIISFIAFKDAPNFVNFSSFPACAYRVRLKHTLELPILYLAITQLWRYET